MTRLSMRRTTALTVALVAPLALSGCFTMNMDFEVDSDDEVSGTMIFAIDETWAEMAEQDEEELFDTGDLPEGATAEPYAEDGRVGQKVTFDGVPLEEWNRSMAETSEGAETPGSDTFSLVHEDGQYVFKATMDTMGSGQDSEEADEPGDGSASPDPSEDLLGEDFEESMEQMMKMMLKDAEFTMSITFPGEVTEHNGELDGRTVTWDLDLTATEPVEFTAVADEPGAVKKAVDSVVPGGNSDDVPWGPIIGIGALVLVGLGLLALVLMRRKRPTPSV